MCQRGLWRYDGSRAKTVIGSTTADRSSRSSFFPVCIQLWRVPTQVFANLVEGVIDLLDQSTARPLDERSIQWCCT
jgi:hypothetical protein